MSEISGKIERFFLFATFFFSRIGIGDYLTKRGSDSELKERA